MSDSAKVAQAIALLVERGYAVSASDGAASAWLYLDTFDRPTLFRFRHRKEDKRNHWKTESLTTATLEVAVERFRTATSDFLFHRSVDPLRVNVMTSDPRARSTPDSG